MTSTGSNIYSNNDTRYSGNWICEFDVIECTSSCTIRIWDTRAHDIAFSSLNIQNGSHVLFKNENNIINFYTDGNPIVYSLPISSDCTIGLKLLLNTILKISYFHVYVI